MVVATMACVDGNPNSASSFGLSSSLNTGGEEGRFNLTMALHACPKYMDTHHRMTTCRAMRLSTFQNMKGRKVMQKGSYPSSVARRKQISTRGMLSTMTTSVSAGAPLLLLGEGERLARFNFRLTFTADSHSSVPFIGLPFVIGPPFAELHSSLLDNSALDSAGGTATCRTPNVSWIPRTTYGSFKQSIARLSVLPISYVQTADWIPGTYIGSQGVACETSTYRYHSTVGLALAQPFCAVSKLLI